MDEPSRPRIVAEWLILGALVGAACGAGSAIFLFALDRATGFREAHESLVYALPLAGLVVGALYERFGAPVRGGNDLVIDTIHDGGSQIPLRMAPMVIAGTILTHLFGGSAGREGTAVQMGASLADAIAHRAKAGPRMRRQLLAAGVAGGFGSVFGTPFAGVMFGLEVVVVGRFEVGAIVPALVSSLVGDLVTRRLGIHHTDYPAVAALQLTPLVAGKWVLFALAVAVTSVVFVELTHRLKKLLTKILPRLPLRMMVGGAAVVVMWKVMGTSDYLGLGVPVIVRAFGDPTLAPWAFAAKLVFTAVTLGAGFLGGEVTPLFFIGAALGNVVGRALGLPLDLATGVGLAAVFAASANTPLALSIMAVELLGVNVLPHVLIVALLANLLTGHRGIYLAQRVLRRRAKGAAREPVRLGDLETLTPGPSPPGGEGS